MEIKKPPRGRLDFVTQEMGLLQPLFSNVFVRKTYLFNNYTDMRYQDGEDFLYLKVRPLLSHLFPKAFPVGFNYPFKNRPACLKQCCHFICGIP